MNMNILLSGLMYVVTFIVLSMAYYSFKKVKAPGSRTFAVVCFVSSIYTFGCALAVISPTLELANFWNKIQYIGLPFIGALWVTLSIDFCGTRHKHNKLFFIIIMIIPILTVFFRFTSDIWGLYYSHVELASNGIFTLLHYTKGPWYYVHFLYFIFCEVYSTQNYLMLYSKSKGQLKRQALLMAAASAIPIGATCLNFFSGFDYSAFFLIIDYSIFLVGIFQFSFLNLVPLARDKVFDRIQDAVLVVDLNLRLFDSNIAAKKLFPQMRNMFPGVELKEILKSHPDITKVIYAWNSESNTKKILDNIVNLEFSMEHPNGYPAFYHVRISKLLEKYSNIGSVVMISDITSSKEFMTKLEDMARKDMLTGLINRRYFIERVQYELDRSIRGKLCFSLIIFDLDLFKSLNDTYGHLGGDVVLCEVATRCKQQLRLIDIVARYGGEEFIIFLPETDEVSAIKVAERLRISFESETVAYLDNEIPFQASFGVTTYDCSIDNKEINYDNIVRSADEALYEAKEKGRNKVIHKKSQN